jgi:hypothetical protein
MLGFMPTIYWESGDDGGVSTVPHTVAERRTAIPTLSVQYESTWNKLGCEKNNGTRTACLQKECKREHHGERNPGVNSFAKFAASHIVQSPPDCILSVAMSLLHVRSDVVERRNVRQVTEELGRLLLRDLDST